MGEASTTRSRTDYITCRAAFKTDYEFQNRNHRALYGRTGKKSLTLRCQAARLQGYLRACIVSQVYLFRQGREFIGGTCKPLGELSHLSYGKHTIVCVVVRKESDETQATVSSPLTLLRSPVNSGQRNPGNAVQREQRPGAQSRAEWTGRSREDILPIFVRSRCQIYETCTSSL